jgi:hypothetical protein
LRTDAGFAAAVRDGSDGRGDGAGALVAAGPASAGVAASAICLL